MNTTKVKSIMLFILGAGLIRFSVLPQTLNYPLFILGLACLTTTLILTLSLIFQWRLLTKTAEHINRISKMHVSVFLALASLGLGLVQAEYILPGILVILVAYIILGLTIGWQLGSEVLRPLFNKFNIFQPSSEIPKEFKNQGWGL